VENFKDMYVNYPFEFKSCCLSFSVNPMCFILKDTEVVVYRNKFHRLEICKEIDDDMLGNYCAEIFRDEIEKYREYCKRHILANPNVGYLSSEQEESFYEMIELAIKDELESST
jgi:hypothetical protein